MVDQVVAPDPISAERIKQLEQQNQELFNAVIEFQAKLDISIQAEGAIRNAWTNDKMVLAQRFKQLQEQLQSTQQLATQLRAENIQLKSDLDQASKDLETYREQLDAVGRQRDALINEKIGQRASETPRSAPADDDIPF